MTLSFKEWIIAEVKKRQLPVHQNMKQWVKSVENLEKELETLKAIFKDKKLNTKKDDKNQNDKDIAKKINVIDKKLDTKKDDKTKDVKKINVIDKKLDTKKDDKKLDKKPENKQLPEIPKPILNKDSKRN